MCLLFRYRGRVGAGRICILSIAVCLHCVGLVSGAWPRLAPLSCATSPLPKAPKRTSDNRGPRRSAEATRRAPPLPDRLSRLNGGCVHGLEVWQSRRGSAVRSRCSQSEGYWTGTWRAQWVLLALSLRDIQLVGMQAPKTNVQSATFMSNLLQRSLACLPCFASAPTASLGTCGAPGFRRRSLRPTQQTFSAQQHERRVGGVCGCGAGLALGLPARRPIHR